MEVFKPPQALHSFVNCNFCPHPSWQVVNTPSSCASHSPGWCLYKHRLLKKWCFVSKLCLRPVCISWCRQSQLALFTLQACQSGASSSLQQETSFFRVVPGSSAQLKCLRCCISEASLSVVLAQSKWVTRNSTSHLASPLHQHGVKPKKTTKCFLKQYSSSPFPLLLL